MGHSVVYDRKVRADLLPRYVFDISGTSRLARSGRDAVDDGL